MKKAVIRFASVNQIVQFVNIVSHYGTDIDIRIGNRVVDAKSLLGVMSFGIGKLLELVILKESCDDLIDKINFCIVA